MLATDLLPSQLAGNYFYPASSHAVGTNNALSVGALRMSPWVVWQPVTIDKVGAEITAAGDVGSKLRLAIYRDGGDGRPSALVVDAGTIAGDTVGVQEITLGAVVTLTPGYYWIGGAVQNVVTTQPTVRTTSFWSPPYAPVAVGTTIPAAGGTAVGRSVTGITGAAPATISGGGAVTQAPRVFVKAAATQPAPIRPIVDASAPPFPLLPMAFDNVTDDAPRLQAIINAVDGWGGGDVLVSAPSRTYKILTGITLPSGVRYIGGGKNGGNGTLCNASGITSGAAFTVNGAQDSTVICGLWMDGGLFTPTVNDLTSTYMGVKVVGIGLKLEDCHLQFFGRGFDTASSNTFAVVFEDCSAQHCATGWYSDITAAGATVAGERNTWRGGALANNYLGVRASAGGQHIRLESTSLDFNTVAGSFTNAKVFFSGHLEMNSSTGVDYCFEVTGNTQFSACQVEAVLGAGLYKMFRNDGTATYGPANIGFGNSRWKQCNVFYTDQSATSGTKTSEYEFTFPSGVTSTTIHFPFPGKWSAPTAKFLASHDGLYITPLSSTNGTYTLTASASSASTRQCRVDFG